MERNTAIAVVCDKGKMFGARIQFPDQFYIGFDIIVVDESSQVSSLVFRSSTFTLSGVHSATFILLSGNKTAFRLTMPQSIGISRIMLSS